MKLRLHYWNCRGRAQTLRYIAADLAHDNAQIQYEETFESIETMISAWPDRKVDPHVSGPFGTLPVLHVDDRDVLGQTLSIGKTLAQAQMNLNFPLKFSSFSRSRISFVRRRNAGATRSAAARRRFVRLFRRDRECLPLHLEPDGSGRTGSVSRSTRPRQSPTARRTAEEEFHLVLLRSTSTDDRRLFRFRSVRSGENGATTIFAVRPSRLGEARGSDEAAARSAKSCAAETIHRLARRKRLFAEDFEN